MWALNHNNITLYNILEQLEIQWLSHRSNLILAKNLPKNPDTHDYSNQIISGLEFNNNNVVKAISQMVMVYLVFIYCWLFVVQQKATRPLCAIIIILYAFILLYLCNHIAYGATISILTDSICSDSNNSSQSSVVVQSSPVNLTCCVEDFLCSSWTISWYRNSSSGEISNQPTLTVNLTEPQETFKCVANSDTIDPVCYGVPGYQDVALIQGKLAKYFN